MSNAVSQVEAIIRVRTNGWLGPTITREIAEDAVKTLTEYGVHPHDKERILALEEEVRDLQSTLDIIETEQQRGEAEIREEDLPPIYRYGILGLGLRAIFGDFDRPHGVVTLAAFVVVTLAIVGIAAL